MSNSLIEFWSKFEPKPGTLNIHPTDLEWIGDDAKRKQILQGQSPRETFGSFLKSKRLGDENDRSLHLNLLPAPFHGNLRKASIFILLMNPGFGTADYFAEEDREFRDATIANLKQKEIDEEFPYFTLNPKFAWSGAYQWIESRMRPVLRELRDQQGKGYYDALSVLSKQIAVVELFPYHSSNGKAIPTAAWGKGKQGSDPLPSVAAARRFVSDDLLKSDRKPLIVVARAHKRWFPSRKTPSHIIELPKNRGVSFSLETRNYAGRKNPLAAPLKEKLGLK